MYFSCSEDLFKLVWEGGAAGQPAASSIPQPELPCVSPKPPPSDDMMAAWLYPIVSGEVDHAGDSAKILAEVKSEPEPSMMATVSLGRMTPESKGKLPAKDDIFGAKVRPYAPYEFQMEHLGFLPLSFWQEASALILLASLINKT
jgi:hypothetical protein